MRCLEKDPDDRFRNAGELRRALKECRRALLNPEHRDIIIGLEDGETRTFAPGTVPVPPEASSATAPRRRRIAL